MSKKEMAHAIGATPETFSRLLLKLRRKRLLYWQKKEILCSKNFWKKLEF
jgi:CRP-like cAMP-binding protein